MGFPGWRIDQIYNISSEWSSYKPDAILLLIGTNDVMQGSQLKATTRTSPRSKPMYLPPLFCAILVDRISSHKSKFLLQVQTPTLLHHTQLTYSHRCTATAMGRMAPFQPRGNATWRHWRNAWIFSWLRSLSFCLTLSCSSRR